MSFVISAGIEMKVTQSGVQSISLVEQSLKNTHKEMKAAAGGSDKLKSSLKSLASGGFAVMQKSVLAATAAFGAFTVASSRAASNFQKGIAEIKTIATGASFDIDKLTKSAQEMAVQFGTKNTEQAAALYQAISSGARDSAQAQKVASTANKLAVAGLAELEPTMKSLVSTANAFGISLSDVDRVSDVYFTTVKKGIIKVEELGPAMGNVAPFASKFGVSLEETAAALATLTKNGLNAEIASTVLKNAIVKLAAPSKQARDELKRLGIENIDLVLKTKGLAAAFDLVASNSKTTTQSLKAIFGDVRGLSAALNLTGDSALTFADAMREIENSAGATDEAFSIMSQTTDMAFNRLKALGEQVLTTFGTAVNQSEQAKTGLAGLAGVLERLDGFFRSEAGKAFADNVMNSIASSAEVARNAIAGMLAVAGATDAAAALGSSESDTVVSDEKTRLRRIDQAVAAQRNLNSLNKEQVKLQKELNKARIRNQELSEKSVVSLNAMVDASKNLRNIRKKIADNDQKMIATSANFSEDELRHAQRIIQGKTTELEKQKEIEQAKRDAEAKEQRKRQQIADSLAKRKEIQAAIAAAEDRHLDDILRDGERIIKEDEAAEKKAIEERAKFEQEVNQTIHLNYMAQLKEQIATQRREALETIRILAGAGRIGAAKDVLARQGSGVEDLTPEQKQQAQMIISRAQVRKSEEAQRELRRQAKKTAFAYKQLGDTMGRSISNAVGMAIESGEGFKGVMKGMGLAALDATAQIVSGYVQQAIAGESAATSSIFSSSASAGAKGADSASGLPFPANVIVAPIVAGLMFALARGFLSKFETGGQVLGMGQKPGEVPIIAHQGEIVVPVDKIKKAQSGGDGSRSRGGGPTIIVNQQSMVTPTSRVEANRVYRDSLAPALGTLVDQNKASFSRKRFKGRQGKIK